MIGFQVDYIAYSDELAEQIGCKPNLWKLMIQDPALAMRCIFGPCTPPQFRLMGPGVWPEAKKAIEQVNQNTVFPTKTRTVNNKEGGAAGGVMFKFLVFAVLILALLLIRW